MRDFDQPVLLTIMGVQNGARVGLRFGGVPYLQQSRIQAFFDAGMPQAQGLPRSGLNHRSQMQLVRLDWGLAMLGARVVLLLVAAAWPPVVSTRKT